MKPTFILLLAFATFSLAGCLKTRDELRPDAGTSRPQQQQTVSQQQAATTPAAVPAPRRNDSMRMDEIEEQLRVTNGRLETLEQAHNENKNVKQASKEEVEQKFKAYEEELRVLHAKVQALTEYQEQKTVAVETKTKNPKALYERGEELFKEKKWKEAISSYQKYREAQPKGAEHADATYKIGVSFQELNMKDEARTFYEEVIQKAPKSREAKKAAIRLKSLK